jgi:hypothetical protein
MVELMFWSDYVWFFGRVSRFSARSPDDRPWRSLPKGATRFSIRTSVADGLVGAVAGLIWCAFESRCSRIPTERAFVDDFLQLGGRRRSEGRCVV